MRNKENIANLIAGVGLVLLSLQAVPSTSDESGLPQEFQQHIDEFYRSCGRDQPTAN